VYSPTNIDSNQDIAFQKKLKSLKDFFTDAEINPIPIGSDDGLLNKKVA